MDDGYSDLAKAWDKIDRLAAALQKIAAPKRPDGTYNLSREACERLAREALGKRGE